MMYRIIKVTRVENGEEWTRFEVEEYKRHWTHLWSYRWCAHKYQFAVIESARRYIERMKAPKSVTRECVE